MHPCAQCAHVTCIIISITRISPPPLSQVQGVATGRNVMAAAAGARGAGPALFLYGICMDGRGGCSPRPKYLNIMPGRPGIPQAAT